MAKPKYKSLKSGRPPTATKPKTSISSKATQKTIVTFHNLQKNLAKAESQGDAALAASIKSQIEALGGLKAYQAASIQGQSVDRGGDSSIVLLKWLEPVRQQLAKAESKLEMLEVGALSTQNACSKSGMFEIERIDLNSQSAGILQQDFMARPIPSSNEHRFDIISLSLVLNFVPDAKGRGEMLRRTTKFLHRRMLEGMEDFTALLFLVLPASCVVNSRYCNDERLALIMASLGYVLLQRKQTSKLVYYLWQLRDRPAPNKEQSFGKVKLRDGGTMNNFCIVIEPEAKL